MTLNSGYQLPTLQDLCNTLYIIPNKWSTRDFDTFFLDVKMCKTFFLESFQPMASTFDDSSLSLDQNTN